MKDTNAIKEELQEIAPLLAQQKAKREPFQLPDNYFKTLEEQLLDSIEATDKTPLYQPTRKIIQLSTSILSKAAAIALLVGGSFIFWQQNKSSTSIHTALSSEELTAYIADNLHEFEEDFLLEYDMVDALSMDAVPLEAMEVEVYLEEVIEEVEVSDLEHFF